MIFCPLTQKSPCEVFKGNTVQVRGQFSIHRAGQRRLEKAADALKVSGGLLSLRNQPTETSGSRCGASWRLTLNAPPYNLRPRYNVCPADTIDAIVFEQGVRSLVPMRWGLVPRWWSKTLKDIKLATFTARAETVTTKPFFRVQAHTLCYSGFRLLRVAGYPGRKAALVFHSKERISGTYSCGPLG